MVTICNLGFPSTNRTMITPVTSSRKAKIASRPSVEALRRISPSCYSETASFQDGKQSQMHSHGFYSTIATTETSTGLGGYATCRFWCWPTDYYLHSVSSNIIAMHHPGRRVLRVVKRRRQVLVTPFPFPADLNFRMRSLPFSATRARVRRGCVRDYTVTRSRLSSSLYQTIKGSTDEPATFL